MNFDEILTIGQASKSEMGEIFNDMLRGITRQAVMDVMLSEVEQLCGAKYGRENEHVMRRAGSASGSIHIQNRTEKIDRPRVRRRNVAGKDGEVTLRTYEAAKDGSGLRDSIIRALENGVSTRAQQELHPDAKRCSKSEISRQWQETGRKRIQELRDRPLDDCTYVALMLDGVVLGKDLTAIIALGITEDGRKRMLDFDVGSSENAEICISLCNRLVQRGFRASAKYLLVILDGSKALRKAAKHTWPDCLIQRCLVHLQRNMRARLSHRWYGQLKEHFSLIRKAGNLEAANEAFDKLYSFVKKHSFEGGEILKEVRQDALMLFEISPSDHFNRSLLSTNSIENSIRNMRSIISRPKRWRQDTDMPSRWLAAAMLKAEKGFQRISRHSELPKLIKGINEYEPKQPEKEDA